MNDNYSTGGWNAEWDQHAGYDCMTGGWDVYFTGNNGEKRLMFTVDEREFGGDRAWDRETPSEASSAFVEYLLRRLRGG